MEQMDSAELNLECIEETCSDQLLAPGYPEISSIVGDQQVLPRIGDQYQVEIPPLIEDSGSIQLIKKSIDSDDMVDVTNSFLMGLPIPIMWVHDELANVKLELLECLGNPDEDQNGLVEFGNNKEDQIILNNGDLKLESLDVSLKYGKGVGPSQSLESTAVVSKQMDVELPMVPENKSNLVQMRGGRTYCPFPGSLGGSWSDIEKESFILGLYVFGKNLIQVKKFMESKEMGDILSFYYGEFYRSDGHRKWSECRKMRSRKCIHGQRIFTGWRQQELLSRLLPHMSEECQNTLLEVSRTFGEGKISLEEFTSTLKATVGMKVLIEAVGIGKGKQDLTGIMMEPLKANQVISTRPEIPIGKACSLLTSGDIIKFLTGDFRLSKARSNDLFWEAVWPRLLARGWHSEQPKNHGYTGSKHALVFLVPGVKKFSRRRLVKGNQYFDSVSDVLNKVASDPRLLELEVEAVKSEGKEEFSWDSELKLDQGGFSDHQRPCYLRPRLSNCKSELMKFTIVDTSLVHGEEPSKVRELRSIPVDTTNTSIPTNISREPEGDSSDENVDYPNPAHNQGDANTSSPSKVMFDRGSYSDTTNCIKHAMPTYCQDPSNGPSDNHGNSYRNIEKQPRKTKCPVSQIVNGPGPSSGPSDNHVNTNSNTEKQPKKTRCKVIQIANGPGPSSGPSDNLENTYSNTEKQPRKTRCKVSQRVKPSQSNHAPVTKRRRLTACSHSETSRSRNSFSVAPVQKQEEPSLQSNSPFASDNMVSLVRQSLDKVSSTGSSAKGSPDESSEGILTGNCFGELHNAKPQSQTLIDLNLPHAPPDFETEEPFTEDVDSLEDPKRSLLPSEISQQPEDSKALRTNNANQQPTVNARRQSTRNRPLTTKALEALACGFTNTKRRKRSAEALSREISIPRPSRRSRGKVGVTGNWGVEAGVVDSKVVEMVVDGECSSNAYIVCKSQVGSEKNGTYHPEVLMCKDD
ncbi:uncharacterized protein LOC122092155 isoform X2 [Macadamia integrifolia]|uniref:uncharacterized protein LOC122092155 isoform X2 n=1 Tax=Macadamia integrifolia TaxID=60698 RepID=UPI001C4E4FAB|nr:uncharacterized protein LOC122092155 isoform X2 [Macadamia integrifolia]